MQSCQRVKKDLQYKVFEVNGRPLVVLQLSEKVGINPITVKEENSRESVWTEVATLRAIESIHSLPGTLT